MTPRLRKLGLTAHVASSAGWLGAVSGFLALVIAGLTPLSGADLRGARIQLVADAGAAVSGVMTMILIAVGVFLHLAGRGPGGH